jgi:hypothetical protein
MEAVRLSVLAALSLLVEVLPVKPAAGVPWPQAAPPFEPGEDPNVALSTGFHTRGSDDPQRRTVVSQRLTMQAHGRRAAFATGLGWVTLSQKDRAGAWLTTSVPGNIFFSFRYRPALPARWRLWTELGGTVVAMHSVWKRKPGNRRSAGAPTGSGC